MRRESLLSLRLVNAPGNDQRNASTGQRLLFCARSRWKRKFAESSRLFAWRNVAREGLMFEALQ
ncbi:MAG: hypothetical protein GPOALKHO_000405 [Sodalis sp.]|nr:MAG: hypothetical protein GPOALKHO_000405 [Sodalis sp.]